MVQNSIAPVAILHKATLPLDRLQDAAPKVSYVSLGCPKNVVDGERAWERCVVQRG